MLRVREETRSFMSGRSTGSVDAPQPWNIVELRFLPAGRTKPVTAVDSVDAGWVAGRERGARLTVTYNAAHPRVKAVLLYLQESTGAGDPADTPARKAA